MNNDVDENQPLYNNKDARRSSFAQEFYNAGGAYNYDYQPDSPINAAPYSPPRFPPEHVAPEYSSLAPNAAVAAAPPPQQPMQMAVNPHNSNQNARNNRNYDKLRGGNVMNNNNNPNTSANNISRDHQQNQQNLSNLANYNYNHNVSDSSMSNQFGGGAAGNHYGYGQAQHHNQNNFNPVGIHHNQHAANHQQQQQPNAMNIRQVQQEQTLNRLKQEMVNDGCCSFLIVLIVLVFGMSGNDCPEAPLRMWIMVECSYYAFNILFAYAYYKRLLSRRRDDIRFQVANCLLNLMHSGWLIYGNILYFQNNAACQNKNTSSSLMWIMLALVIFGYVTLIKCCTYTSLFICFGPLIYRQYRRARRPDANWQAASKDILKQVVRNKFQPGENEETQECIICMCEYQPNDEIIELPCDRRHFFHSTCIENWLKKNNSCPMCKKPITLEDIKSQKKKKKSERT